VCVSWCEENHTPTHLYWQRGIAYYRCLGSRFHSSAPDCCILGDQVKRSNTILHPSR
jgi:hypothetical protein